MGWKIVDPTCCCTPGLCCPNWKAPTTLYVQIESDCAGIDSIEFELTGTGGASRSWSNANVDLGCDTYSFNLLCDPKAEYPWRLTGSRNYDNLDECYGGLFGEDAFEMIRTQEQVTCSPFAASFPDQVSGLACSFAATQFHVSENPLP